jgi:hypothetical protein
MSACNWLRHLLIVILAEEKALSLDTDEPIMERKSFAREAHTRKWEELISGEMSALE